MHRMKKILAVLVAMVLFGLVTVGFVRGLQDTLSRKWQNREQNLVYHRPETVPTEPPETTVVTEPPETEPEPPETVPVETEPAIQRTYYEQVPLYDQSVYTEIRYRSGTLATSGSNITSLAMVASYLAKYEYRPDQLAECFADYIGNSMQWLEYASDQLQLPWKKAVNIDETIGALKEGKIAIALMNERSIFLEGQQHFVVFTGITEEGKILIHDPFGPNYSAWHLQNALVSGFARTDLTGGYSGGWIYDPAAMPEEPFVYEAPENTDAFRYEGLELSEHDLDMIARLVRAEGESEPFEGQQAIAEVILNRIAAGNFPNTANDVIFADDQFMGVGQLYLEDPVHTQYEAVERALYGPYVLDADVVFFSQYAVNDNVWGTIGKHVFCRQW